MSDATSVLFGLEHEFSVLEVQRVDTATVKVIIEQAAREGPCPECGVVSGTVKDRPWMRLKDLPVSGQIVELLWRKRRLICGEGLCPQKTFTQVSAAVRPRARVTERLRERVAQAIASGNRAVSEVAGEYRVSWPTAHKALRRHGGCLSQNRRAGWASMRPASGRSVGSLTASPGNGPIRG